MTSLRAVSLALAVPLLVAGCAGLPEIARRPPSVAPTAAFAEVPADASPVPDAAWWEALGDPTLNALVARALRENRDVLAAEASLRQARAIARLQGWTLLPTGNVSADYTRQRQAATALQFGGVDQGFATGPLDDVDVFSLGLEAAWEVDVFGRLRGQANAARADAQAALADRRGALVAVAAETAAQYAAYRGAQARVAAARANVEAQRETLRLTEALRTAGRGTRLDVARAREQLAATETLLAGLEGDLAATFYGLAVIVGGGFGDTQALLGGGEAAIPAAPSVFGVGAPEELLRRRPDVAAAERRLVAAGFRVSAQRVDWWPRVTLVGGASLSAFSVEDLSSQNAFGFSIGPQIDWPLLDFRRNQLRTQAARAGAELAYQQFDRTVARALADVESGLVGFAAARRAAEAARIGAEAAREAAELARLRYREGVDPFLQVLDAERRLAEAEDRRAQAAAQAAIAYARLGQALGAGWQVSEPAIGPAR